jgi:predicted nuclease of predicted toxin-antitoxin system
MRFLVDECTGPAVARWLRAQQHDVFSVYDEARGIGDEEVIERAFAENRVLVTNDKDFGEKIFRERLPHRGVILLRLADDRYCCPHNQNRRNLGMGKVCFWQSTGKSAWPCSRQ